MFYEYKNNKGKRKFISRLYVDQFKDFIEDSKGL